MSQITHDNHFVPQAYLKRWSNDGIHIACYRTLVSHKNVNEWQRLPIRGIAYQRDLYTSLVDAQESDEFEKWITTEFEAPANDVIEKLINGKELIASDWDKLVLYAASQDFRTPQNYIEMMGRLKEDLPGVMQRTLEKSVKELEAAKREGRKPKETPPEIETQLFENNLKIEIIPNTRPETKEGEIRVETIVGRRLWLQALRHLLTNTAQKFLSHTWCIAEAANNSEWFTSDHPVVRLNYYGEGNYDFKGGWGRKGVDIFMPLSPKYLLFTQIGEDIPRRFVFSEGDTLKIKKCIAERAHRMIFARYNMHAMKRLRPREINVDKYREEQDAWRNWHQEQSLAEQEYDDDSQ
jgi:DNA-binding HxlR family transcriptional regulator